MQDIAGKAVRATKVGARGVMKPSSDTGEALAAFQAVQFEAERLNGLGVISIHDIHRENSSGYRHVDRITFTRLR